MGLGTKDNTSKLTLITSLTKIKTISAKSHSSAVDIAGNLFIWGPGVFGEYIVPQNITSIPSKIVTAQIGGTSGAALDATGLIWVWGSNSKGELGVGDY